VALADQESMPRPRGRTRRAGRSDPGHFADLVLHLARREVSSMHRFTLLGWAWPVVRQLAQLIVLVFVFSTILSLGIPDFPVYVFSGLIAWSWFAAGVQAGTSCLLAQRHLVFQPHFPTAVLPVVAVAVPFIDVLLVLPVLAGMLVVTGELHATLVLFPAVLAVQLVLMCGIAWLAAATTVFLRDVQNIVTVGLLLLFYLTPIFYSTDVVPPEYLWILHLNPMTTMVDAYRAVLLDQAFPSLDRSLAVLAFSVLLAGAGRWYFRRQADRFVDHL
jgi:lipopolysaccharide transport system permease protein